MAFNIGDLNRLVTIERPIDTPNDQGGYSRSWATVGRAWVKATPIGGGEALVAGTLQARQPWRLEMHWRRDLTTEHRMTAGWLPAGKALEISSVTDPDGRRQRLVVLGEAVSPGETETI